MVSLSSGEDGTQMVVLKSNNSGNDSSYEMHIPGHSKRNYSRWSPLEEGVTLSWRDLTVYVKNKKNRKPKLLRIVNNVTGAVKAGSLVALMGSSGAGKSTLMSALAFRNSSDVEVDGDILVNGRPLGNYMKYMSGFMHQEDIFVGSLTVYEHMNIMAHLKLDRRVSDDERNEKIHEILNQLGLIKCLNTRIGSEMEGKSLSGGERKRLSFASELLTDPAILFCDEPTTGLDSYSAQKLVKIMNSMASVGKTILCTIHQPSSDIFNMFSQIILVAEGRIAFMGCTGSAIEFLHNLGYPMPSHYNPSDFFIKTLAITPGHEDNSKQTVKRICDHFIVSDYFKEIDVVVQYEFHMGRAEAPRQFTVKANFREMFWWWKIYWLTNRWFLEILRKPSVQLYKIVQKIAIATMIALCYLGTNIHTQKGVQSIQGAIFMFVTENTFYPMYSVLAEFPENTPLFLREYKSGLYQPIVYYLSRILSMLPGFILEPVLFSIVAYWLSGLRPTADAFLSTTLIAVLTMNISTACGVFFSNAFDSAPRAMAYLIPYDFILLVTSGLFIKLNTLAFAINWTKYLSWLMYATESISIIQWNGITNITCETMNVPCVTTGEEVLNKFSFSETNFHRNLFIMTSLLFVFYVLGFLCLWWKIKRRH